jgi:effector-binding domain-containing protein
MSQAFDALLPWIKESGYRVAGPGRDVYLQSSTGGNQNDPTCVTEIFFPVERA